jgi:hypothetical protein
MKRDNKIKNNNDASKERPKDEKRGQKGFENGRITFELGK